MNELQELENQIKELRAKRINWLEENMDFIEDCRLIARHLGSCCNHRNICNEYVFEIKDYFLPITIKLYPGLGDLYLYHLQKYEERETLTIRVGKYMVCRYYFTNDNKPYKPHEHLFIPGDYMEKIKLLIASAQNKQNNLNLIAARAELDQLETEMLTGIKI